MKRCELSITKYHSSLKMNNITFSHITCIGRVGLISQIVPGIDGANLRIIQTHATLTER